MKVVIACRVGTASGGTAEDGAHERNRTFDLLLTKEVLYRLSYVSNDVERGAAWNVQWSGRRESNPHHQLGRLRFYR